PSGGRGFRIPARPCPAVARNRILPAEPRARRAAHASTARSRSGAVGPRETGHGASPGAWIDESSRVRGAVRRPHRPGGLARLGAGGEPPARALATAGAGD